MPPSRRPARILTGALAADARIIALIAPAGYGKSTLARALVDAYGGAHTIDCSAFRDVQTFREAIAAAGASNMPALLFENAETLLALSGAVEAVAERLGAAQSGARIILCSRLHIPFGRRNVDPSTLHTIGAEELALSESEARDLLVQNGASAEQVRRALRLAAGWPMALAMFARCARSGRLDAVLDAVSASELRDLMQYLMNDALAAFDDTARLLLQIAALVPQARFEDLRHALAPADVEAVLNAVLPSPFARRDGTVIEIHPLVRLALAGLPRERATRAIAASAHAQEAFAPLRAAELLLCADRPEDAARVLQKLGAEALRVGHAYSRVLSLIDPAVLVRYPALWMGAAQSRLHRISSAQYAAECQAVLQNLDRCDSPAVRVMIAGLSVSVFHETLNGALVEGVLERARRDAHGDPQATMLVQYFGALHEAFLDRAPDPQPLRVALAPILLIPEIRFSFEAMVAAPHERLAGHIERERAALERAVDAAMNSQMPALVPLGHWELAYHYWRTGESERFAHHLSRCELTLSDAQVPAFAALIACARGNGEAQSDAYPRLRMYAAMMGASACSDAHQRTQLLYEAKAIASELNQSGQLALTELALAFASPEARDEHLDAAAAAARAVGAGSLVSAIENKDFGAPMVAGVVRHFRFPAPPRQAPLTIQVLRCSAQLNERDLDISGRKFELLALLALAKRSLTRTELTAKMWPDLTESRARNSLNVTVSALRDLLGRDAIVFKDGAYALQIQADVDVNRIDALAKRLRALQSSVLSSSDCSDAARAIRELETLDESSIEWEWFKPIAARLWALRREVLLALARSEFLRGGISDALKHTEALVALDACDEEARMLRINLHLTRGDRASAFVEYRDYVRVLHDELGIEPSPELLSLVRNTWSDARNA